MASETEKTPAKLSGGYLEKTHRPLNCLMFLLPLLAAYETGQLFFRSNLLAPTRIAAVLEPFGAPGRLVPPLVIILIMLLWHIVSHEPWKVDAGALAGMAAESIVGMLPLFGLWILTTRLLGPVHLNIAQPQDLTVSANVLSGIGAGIYEEFVFRLLAMGLVLFVTVDLLHGPKRAMVVLAMIVSAISFALCHFVGHTPFDWYYFVFFALAGAYLATIFIARGFGVAVGTHACYNVVISLAPLFTAAVATP